MKSGSSSKRHAARSTSDLGVHTVIQSREAADLVIGGFERLSLVDWPGQLTAVVFCQGCAWLCAYCHNPHLLPFKARDASVGGSASSSRLTSWKDIREWLIRREGLLDAVVFSGGEATLQSGLPTALQDVRAMGFMTGLHTGGPIPARLAVCLPHLDWVGFDFKAPFNAYEKVTLHRDGSRARQSMRLLRESGIACEVRTTWHPALLSDAMLFEMAETLVDEGFDEWVIQRFRAEGCLDPALAPLPADAVPCVVEGVPSLNVRVR